MAKIAVDCDGVLADFETSFIAEVNKIWPGRLPTDYVKRDMDDWGDLTKAEMAQVWDRIDATPNWWLSLNALSNDVGALAQFLATTKEHDVYICTARKEGTGMTATRQTKVWLFTCGVTAVGNYLGVIAVTHADKKATVYDALGVEWSIDDKGETVVQCDQLEGHRAYLLDKPWNQHVTPKRRVKTMKEFLDAIRAADAA